MFLVVIKLTLIGVFTLVSDPGHFTESVSLIVLPHTIVFIVCKSISKDALAMLLPVLKRTLISVTRTGPN